VLTARGLAEGGGKIKKRTPLRTVTREPKKRPASGHWGERSKNQGPLGTKDVEITNSNKPLWLKGHPDKGKRNSGGWAGKMSGEPGNQNLASEGENVVGGERSLKRRPFRSKDGVRQKRKTIGEGKVKQRKSQESSRNRLPDPGKKREAGGAASQTTE